MTTPELIARRTLDAHQLVAQFPPRLTNANKRVVHDLASPARATHVGRIEVSRWRAAGLPEHVPADGATAAESRPDFYGYEPTGRGVRRVEWYVNFADRHLFYAYGGPLLAQDELQVLEHPALASVREALAHDHADGLAPLTVEDGKPTPILVRGVERRVRLRLAPDPRGSLPFGLYGNAFARARGDAVARATEVLDPPTITNLIAMEAPRAGDGSYARAEIAYVLTTAFTGFAAAREESRRGDGDTAEVIVHTGFWGCGAFGGNHVLMTLLQVVAARLAGVDRLVFHTGDAAGQRHFADAMRVVEKELPRGVARPVEEFVTAIERRGFEWGVGNGT